MRKHTLRSRPMFRSFSGHRSRMVGLTLIEILVALVVISVGLLGVAGLHAYSLKNNYDALLRSHASALAGDIADRMRANRTAALNGEYDIVLGPLVLDEEEDPIPVQVELKEWKDLLASQLPDGDGSIQLNTTADTRIVTIRIQWGEREDDEDADDRIEFVTETEI